MPKFNDAFWKWFGDSKVVDDRGDPLVVYHGTTHVFEKFSYKNCSPEGHFGCGFYFSNNVEDVVDNYAGEGPDLTSRIELRTERIFDEKYNGTDYSYKSKEYNKFMKKAMADARAELSGQRPNVMPCYLRMVNPIIIDPYDSTVFEVEYEEDEDGNITDETGSGMDIINAIRSLAYKYDYDADEIIGQVIDHMNGGSAHQIDEKLREALGSVDDPETGGLAGSEIIKRIYVEAGFDGIIMNANAAFPRMSMPSGTRHYIAFEPNQIKSAIGNDGTWDLNDDDIRSNPRRRR